jgi:hypothetical protein
MRSIVLALAFAAPLSAVAATPNTFTTPDVHTHAAKPQTVFVTLVNRTSQDREVVIGGDVYKLNYNSKLNVSAPVGSSVKVYSQTNSKVNGQELMQVSAADENKTIELK